MTGRLAGLEGLLESLIVDMVAVENPKQDGQVIVAVYQRSTCQDVLDPFLDCESLMWKKRAGEGMMAAMRHSEQRAETNHGQEASQKPHAHA